MGTIIENINENDALSIIKRINSITEEISILKNNLKNAKTAEDKGKEYNNNRTKAKSELDKSKIKKDQVDEARRNINRSINYYIDCRVKWSSVAEDVCEKAAILDLIVTFTASGIKIEEVVPRGSSVPGGIYSNFRYDTIQKPLFSDSYKLKGEIGKDFKKRLEDVYPAWLEMAKAFWSVWKEADEVFDPNYDATIDDLRKGIDKIVSEREKEYDKLNSILKNNYSSYTDTKGIETDIKKFERLIEDNEGEKSYLKNRYKQIFDNDPILGVLQPYNGGYSEQWLKHVEKLASERTQLPYLRLPGKYELLDLSKNKNIYISSNDSEEKGKYFKALLATYLFAFPKGLINIDIIEKDPSPQIVGKLDKSICHITNYNDFQNTTELINRLKQLYKIQENSTDQGKPTQLTVFYGYDDRSFDRIVNELGEVIANGPKRGLYFILVGGEGFDINRSPFLANKFNPEPFKTDINLQGIKVNTTIKINDIEKFKEITLEDWLYNNLSTYEKNVINKICPEVENGDFFKRENLITEILQAPSGKKTEMIVPFGESYNGNRMNLTLSSEIASCTFVVGQTGSGKSFLLHSILTNLMLKYDTTAVKLILMDFKTAGVEFKYYKDVPHVSHLLVNGNDKQIVQEILRSLNDEMARRGEDFKKADCQNVAQYNEYAKSNGKKTYPYIVMAVDECSGLFESDEGIGMRSEEIKKIITKIAKEGRSQGIFMILATQTYHGSGIPHDVIKQFNTFLLQKCSSDDVTDCDINDNDLKARVPYLQQSQVIMYRREPKTKDEGLVYDYAGAKLPEPDKNKYKKTIHDYLCHQANFTIPENKQFYFSSIDCANFKEDELKAITECISEDKICLIPGQRIATDRKPVVCELKQAAGNNVLIVGTNNERQAERVLWSSVISLWKTALHHDEKSVFYIFDNAPDGKSLTIAPPVKQIQNLRNITILNDRLKFAGIDEVFSKVFIRKLEQEQENAKFDEDTQNLDLSELVKRSNNNVYDNRRIYNPLFLILPNHDLFVSQLVKEFNIPKKVKNYKAQNASSQSDELPSEQQFPKSIIRSNPFNWNDSINTGNNNVATTSANTSNATWAALTSIKNYAEALRYILNNGPEVGVYTIIQTSNSGKILPEDKIGGDKLLRLFSEIIMLKMTQIHAENLGLSYHKLVANLSAEIDRLRGLIYSPNASSDNLNYFIPFDFPEDGIYIKNRF